jgi:hypothetical protein
MLARVGNDPTARRDNAIVPEHPAEADRNAIPRLEMAEGIRVSLLIVKGYPNYARWPIFSGRRYGARTMWPGPFANGRTPTAAQAHRDLI